MTANEYNAGDLVEAIKGETVTRGRLKADELGLHLWVGDSGRTPENLESYGFTLSLIEKAAVVVVLPTEPGIYEGSNFPISDGYSPYRLTRGGFWDHLGAGVTMTLMHGAGTLTRLEPVCETAKKVLDRVASWWEFGPPTVWAEELLNIGIEFGVTK